MKKEIAEKWIAALRSGQYKQGKGVLHAKDKFCCLGVLCDLHRQEVGGEWSDLTNQEIGGNWADRPDILWYQPAESGSVADFQMLPQAVASWADTSCNPMVVTYCLTNLNDGLSKTFSEIADLIEKHYEDM